uniref:Uncharacterized protein n=1 Tax=Anguilla anguilla TaxID=7936 RepID=A0A0E9P8H8_ANGAN
MCYTHSACGGLGCDWGAGVQKKLFQVYWYIQCTLCFTTPTVHLQQTKKNYPKTATRSLHFFHQQFHL